MLHCGILHIFKFYSGRVILSFQPVYCKSRLHIKASSHFENTAHHVRPRQVTYEGVPYLP